MPQGIVVAGKALVQPEVAPVLAGDQVAEPLVRELVGDQACRCNVGPDAGIRYGPVVRQRRRRSVLHPSKMILENDLGIFVPRVVVARCLVEEPDHRRGVLERHPCVRRVIRVDVIFQGKRPHAVVQDRKLAGRDHDEVRGMGLVLNPVKRFCFRGLILVYADQAAVGKKCVRIVDRPDHFRRGLVVGMIIAGEPEVVCGVLSLGPDLRPL